MSSWVARFAVLWPALAVCSGCLAPIRASNRSFAPDDAASVRFPGTREETLEWLSNTFQAGGFGSQIRYGRSPNSVYVFQGIRGELLGHVYWGLHGRAPLVGSTVEIGSIFYVYLRPTRDGRATEITLYGKPTVARHELCSEDDSSWNLSCEDVEASGDWTGRNELLGATEAQAVRSLLRALNAQALPTFLPPSTLPRPPRSYADCEWEYQTGSLFQHPYCPNGEKTVVDQYNEDLLASPTWSGNPPPSH